MNTAEHAKLFYLCFYHCIKTAYLFFICALISLGVCLSASAAVVTFEDLNAGKGDLNNREHLGLHWMEWSVMNSTSYAVGSNGYRDGLVSGQQVLFNGGGKQTEISSESGFDFNGAYFTAAFRVGLNIEILGLIDGEVVNERTIQVDHDAPTWFSFNWEGIEKLKFRSFGGKGGALPPGGGYGDGVHFVVDDLVFNEVITFVDEPQLLFVFIFALCFSILRRGEYRKLISS